MMKNTKNMLTIVALLLSAGIMHASESKYSYTGKAAVDHLIETGECRKCNLYGQDLRAAVIAINARQESMLNCITLGWYQKPVDLSGANLIHTNLNCVDLIRANLIDADLTGANLTQSNLIAANLTGANLTRTNFKSANFANITYLLSSYDRHSANLTRVNLTSANLTSANLNGVIFNGANLKNAKFTNAENVSSENFVNTFNQKYAINLEEAFVASNKSKMPKKFEK